MVRVLHTSDWHLGKKLHGESLNASHEKFLEWLHSEIVKDSKPDLLVVAGDIYDRGVPPTDAIEIFEETLAQVQKHGIKVLITSGNHDSRVRLGSNTRFMNEMGLHFRTRLADVTNPVEIEKNDMILLAYGIPYLEPDVDAGPAAHQWQVSPSQTGVLGEAMRLINLDVESRIKKSSKPIKVLVASHAFVQGASPTDSEKNTKDVTKVGGLGQADSSVFKGADYVAMGHIHRPHSKNEIKGPDKTLIRYSGSPMPFSFSERDDSKQILLIKFDEEGVKDTEIESIYTPQVRGMRQIEGNLKEILSSKYPDSDDWVKIILTDKDKPRNVFETLKLKFNHLLTLESKIENLDQTKLSSRGTTLENLTPEEITKRFVEKVTEEEPNKSICNAIDNCCTEVQFSLSQVTK